MGTHRKAMVWPYPRYQVTKKKEKWRQHQALFTKVRGSGTPSCMEKVLHKSPTKCTYQCTVLDENTCQSVIFQQ